MIELTDEEAMSCLQSGENQTAFELLVSRWRTRIIQLLTRLTGSHATGEDLTQEVLLRVFQRRNDFKPHMRFSTWLWRIALNRGYDELRRLSRRPTQPLTHIETDAGASHCRSPGEELAVSEDVELVRRALAELPEMYRLILVLRHYEGLKRREIGELLGIPEGTVNSRLAEAVAKLTLAFERQVLKVPGQSP